MASSRKMTCAVWNGGSERLSIEQWDIPELDSDEVLIRTAYSGICASDLHLINGEVAVAPPRVFGHEFSGVVETVGDAVTSAAPGDRVVAHPVCSCGLCRYCREGKENLCLKPNSIITGRRHGSFSEYVVVKERQVYRIPAGLDLRKAALVEPVAIALHALERTVDLKPALSALVIGAGTIGLILVCLLKASGVRPLIVSEMNDAKRDLALQLGADLAVDPTEKLLKRFVQENMDELGVDLCFEAVGRIETIEQGLEILKPGGSLTIVGWASRDKKASLSGFEIYRKELRINGTFFSPWSFQRAISLVQTLPVERLVSHVYPLAEINKALDVLRSNKGIKVLLRM